MPVHHDPDGSRYVQAEVEVPGTPEAVWQAIASGAGVSAWFVPTRIEGQEGGKVTSEFGPGMEASATITTWDPPHRFVAESRDDMPENGPTIATEWTVEAAAGGTCTVRVVHRWFASTDDWDNQFEGHSYGWIGFFRILRLYLQHFAGQPSQLVQVMGTSNESPQQAWAALAGGLGLADATAGAAVRSATDAPALGGTVVDRGPDEWPSLLLLLDTPAPGVAHLFPLPMGEVVMLSVRLFFYGDQAEAASSAAAAAWWPWMTARFPMPG